MFVIVKLLSGFPKPLVYKVPEDLSKKNLHHCCVTVPLKNKNVSAFVIEQTTKLSTTPRFTIKEIIGLQKLPEDPYFSIFIEKSAKFYLTSPLFFFQKLQLFLKKEVKNKKNSLLTPRAEAKTLLTKEQSIAATYIVDHLDKKKFTPVVLHGVTGSGKTEVYKTAITQALKRGLCVIFLVPEVSLALQFTVIFKNSLGEELVHGFHSGSTAAEKKSVWHALQAKEAVLIIGVHLPVLLPIPNLGLIIIDEEHEQGFEEKKYPKFNSKYLAILRAGINGIPIVLGSATPSVRTMYNVATKGWPVFKLTKRFSGAFPKIQVVSLLKSPKKKKSFWISTELEDELRRCLEKKTQAIIFLNRRGYGFCIQCKKCGFIAECSSCSVAMTAHKNTVDENISYLQCHYCNNKISIPECCPQCQIGGKSFFTKGIGTQKLVEILQQIFPQAKIARADLDTTSKKKLWRSSIDAFEKGEIDFIVGTKSITKGYHFPGVTLVGVIWADLYAHIPVFDAAEQSLQQLIQVAGRAGRVCPESTVIVQTMHDHEILSHLNEADYLDFTTKELEIRKLTNYPPYSLLAKIELKHKNGSQVDLDANSVASTLRKISPPTMTILGPTTPVIYKIQHIEMRVIFIKCKNFNDLENLLHQLHTESYKSQILIHPL